MNSEEAFEAWCYRLWQTHPRAKRRVSTDYTTALDSPAHERPAWPVLYAEELAAHPALHMDLRSDNPVAAVARRARLSPGEVDTFRLWASGASLRAVSRSLGKPYITVHRLIERARWRLRALVDHLAPTG